MQIHVHLLPVLTCPADFVGRTAVVVDILRATTTMLHALQSGAREVIPCLEVDEARDVADRLPGPTVLGGERGGLPIAGFHLGNSPAEYTPARVQNQTVVMTTTNGTRALQACRAADRVLVGAFVNFSRLLAELRSARRVALLCAGTDGHVTSEDVLFAGAVVAELRRVTPESEAPVVETVVETNDEADLAAAAWEATVGNLTRQAALVRALQASRGGRNLLELGMAADILRAAQVDAVPVLGELRLAEWRLVRLPQ